MNRRGPVIAIDGPSGVGKSTISRMIARRLGFRYIDTGAMYRAFAVAAHDEGVDVDDEDALERFCERVEFRFGGDEGERIFLNGRDYTDRIREPSAGKLASIVSTRRKVREFLVDLQRRIAHNGCVVMEGRDIGTVVFPDAEVKIFLDASSRARAERRYTQLAPSNAVRAVEDVAREIEERDARDRKRPHSPLKKADDAVHIDTTELGIREVEERIMEIVEERLAGGGTDS